MHFCKDCTWNNSFPFCSRPQPCFQEQPDAFSLLHWPSCSLAPCASTSCYSQDDGWYICSYPRTHRPPCGINQHCPDMFLPTFSLLSCLFFFSFNFSIIHITFLAFPGHVSPCSAWPCADLALAVVSLDLLSVSVSDLNTMIQLDGLPYLHTFSLWLVESTFMIFFIFAPHQYVCMFYYLSPTTLPLHPLCVADTPKCQLCYQRWWRFFRWSEGWGKHGLKCSLKRRVTHPLRLSCTETWILGTDQQNVGWKMRTAKWNAVHLDEWKRTCTVTCIWYIT